MLFGKGHVKWVFQCLKIYICVCICASVLSEKCKFAYAENFYVVESYQDENNGLIYFSVYDGVNIDKP